MNPLLQELLKRATTPLVPQIGQAADSAADSMTQPSLTTSPNMARLKGFGAGALQGAGHMLSGMTSPLSIGTMLVTGGIGKALGAGSEAVAPTVGRTMNSLAESYTPVAETLGETNPFYTPVGGEAMHNLGRQGTSAAIDPAYSAYLRLMVNRGR